MNLTPNPVAVLIPYFQRQPGILANTVRSVLAQQGFDDYQVIVVDDGSPVPAADELAGITEQRDKITMINQQLTIVKAHHMTFVTGLLMSCF